ncbi:response regulator [Acidithiobacillus sp. IBUN Pt1247-S3]|uniref:response regulator n=1 Tax=Acidithiobacillus sp. IBUN Pt1247-S3 TaxID=3166642 RepID=UPI0034E3D425
MDGHDILLVDDDARLRSLVEAHLVEYGFIVQSLPDSERIEEVLQLRPIDLVILDIGLPHEDGLSICRRLRGVWDLPILMLTARGDELDRIIGLEMGADDYLAKPFHPRELVARVRAILRRSKNVNGSLSALDSELCIGPFRSRTDQQEISFRGKRLPLSRADFLLLHTLMERAGGPVSREQLLWISRGRRLDAEDRSIDMHISRLRRILGAEGNEIIRTVRNYGYQFFAPDQ